MVNQGCEGWSGAKGELADDHPGMGRSGEGKTSSGPGGGGWRRVLEEGLRRQARDWSRKGRIKARGLQHKGEDQEVEKQCFLPWRRGGFRVEAGGSVDPLGRKKATGWGLRHRRQRDGWEHVPVQASKKSWEQKRCL